MASTVFYLFSGLAVLFSLMVILLRNPITSALSLVASFFCVSVIYVLLHASFLGVIQVLIYTGAILVLFLYVLMLLAARGAESETTRESWVRYVGIGLLPVVLWGAFRIIDLPEIDAPVRDETFGSIASVGKMLIGPYALLFEMISLVLLVAIIGVVMLAKRMEHSK